MRKLVPLDFSWRTAAGFSLMELAVVLMILGTLMSGVLVAVSQSASNARITNARAQLREVEEALYGYAQAHGRLPCPATANSSGEEDLTGLDCTLEHGFVPAATLDFYGPVNTDGLLLDPWQNPVRYSVAASPAEFTDEAVLPTLFATPATFTGFGLTVCNNAACAVEYTNSAPAVLYSMGANWNDYSSADELLNGGTGAVTQVGDNEYTMHEAGDDFVSTTYSEDNFDDQIIWLSPYILFARLVEAGKL